MRLPVAVLVLILGIGCEPKPSPEEIAQKLAEEAARSSPTPKPGDWMWKDKKYKSPLEQPAK